MNKSCVHNWRNVVAGLARGDALTLATLYNAVWQLALLLDADQPETPPDGDLVRVVRCCECKRADDGGFLSHCLWCDITRRYVPRDHYCANGERR